MGHPGVVLDKKSTCCMLLVVVAVLFVSASEGQTPDAKLDKIADRFVDQQPRYDPTLSYFTGIPTTDHSRFADRTPGQLTACDSGTLEIMAPHAEAGPQPPVAVGVGV